MINADDTAKDKGSLAAEIMFIALVICSVLVRVVNIASPILEEHAFRQTQTAITIWTFVKEGISFFSYQTPVFGPPWQAPFEFPLFQAAAAVIVKAGLSSIDVAARLTNIIFFYLSAFFLFILCGRFFRERGIAYTIVLCYVLSPYTIFWSRTSMIDYASVAFALGYFYFFLRLLEENEGLFVLGGAVVLGALGYLIKITTMPTVVFPLAYLIVKQLWNNYNKAGGALLSYLFHEKVFFIKLLTAIVVPFAAGYLWTVHADNVKNSSLFTEWLTSGHLEGWNYGTWKQRTELSNWMTILGHVKPFMPFTFVLVPAGLVFALKHPRRYMEFIYTGLFGTLLTVFIFFNLYRAHNYYPMAVTPFLAVAAGFAIYHIFFFLLKNKKNTAALHLKVCIAAACLTLLGYYYIKTATAYLERPLITNKYSPSTISDFIRTITPPDEYIIITDHLWNPSILYYARRKGFMINKDYDYGAGLLTFFKEHKFTTIVTVSDYPELLANWRYVVRLSPQGYKIIGYNIYKVTDDPAVYEDYKKINEKK
ncbi:MAG: glycosyltransferase family 39 protein [Nitrospirae bacterium]|nr:glycosyltransferase family 39 protein [Nitrospirota bacterium]